MIKNLVHKSKITWTGIFASWQSHEGQDPAWQALAREKGWESWAAWRENQADAIDAEKREWHIYEITHPNETIPTFLMGPFRGWQRHYPKEEAHTHSVADLVHDHTGWVQENARVHLLQDHFPERTQFIGVYAEEEDAIILFEGHHRAAAVALQVHDGDPLSFFTPPTIALTEMTAEKIRHLRS
ncbi:MAG: hypothetical protein COU34_04970, partial [Candidatus Magasanikbacteria bacterium CG10_big_fil_rev_8_21_14_0_10_43_9]